MALTELQHAICRLLAELRIRSDIDLFHDTEEAVTAAWDADRERLERHRFAVRTLRERPGFVEAEVAKDGERVRMEWVRDSAYRFFPLVEHAELGLTLHPLDLATNKLLAVVGRREVRDWVDLLECDGRLQPLGYLAWAACGKDPGFSPSSLLQHAARTGQYAPVEIAELVFAGPPPDPAELAHEWQDALEKARAIVALLPPDTAGTCVILRGEGLCRLEPSGLQQALAASQVEFRRGSIRGALPTFRVIGPSA